MACSDINRMLLAGDTRVDAASQAGNPCATWRLTHYRRIALNLDFYWWAVGDSNSGPAD